jgi:hypothetical protein
VGKCCANVKRVYRSGTVTEVVLYTREAAAENIAIEQVIGDKKLMNSLVYHEHRDYFSTPGTEHMYVICVRETRPGSSATMINIL